MITMTGEELRQLWEDDDAWTEDQNVKDMVYIQNGVQIFNFNPTTAPLDAVYKVTGTMCCIGDDLIDMPFEKFVLAWRKKRNTRVLVVAVKKEDEDKVRALVSLIFGTVS